MNKENYLNKVIINLILASIVPFLIFGPFIPDLIVSFSALFFLYHVFKSKEFHYFINKPLIFFFCFCIYCILLSLFIAKDMMLSFESSLFYFRIGVFSCFIWYLINKDKNILIYFYYALVLSFSVLVVDGYIQYLTGVNLLGFKISGVRVSSFFGDELIMGTYLSRLFPLLFAIFVLKEKQKFEIYFIGLLFILVDILIFISGERTAFFFLNLSTVFIIILIKKYQIFRLISFIIAIICIFILSVYSSNLSDRMFKNPLSEMGFTKSLNKSDIKSLNKSDIKSLNKLEKKVIFSEAHESHYRTAYNMFKDKPILGHGPKMFRIICNDQKYAVGRFPCSTHPHNFYLQLMAETGIIGFLFLFSALFYLSYSAYRQLKSIIFKEKKPFSDYQICLLAGILITVWPFSPNGNFFNNWLMVVYSLPLGFYLQSIYSKK